MQLSYSVDFDQGFEGKLQDSKHVDAYSATIEAGEEGKPGLCFGRAVKRGSEYGCIKAFEAATDKAIGVLIHDHVEEGEIRDLCDFSVLRKGRIFVVVTEDVVAGDTVSINAEGAFGTSGTAVSGLEFQSDALAGELAILDVNLPS